MEIRTLAPDEIISEPGFYRMPLSRHHAQPCDAPSVTSGVLRQMELATPADVWAFHSLNPDRWERGESDALRMGVAMALFVEGGKDAVLTGFKLHDEDRPRQPTAAQIAKYDAGEGTEAGIKSVEYWRAVNAYPDAYLTNAELDEICTMGAVLASDPAAAAVMGGEPEITMAVQDERTGLWLLSRPDTVSFDGSVTDYKRMGTKGEPFSYRTVDNAITRYGYDMQISFAASVFEALTMEWPRVAGIVAQWSSPPHHVILREIAEEDLRIAQFRNRRAIDRFAECLKSGHWPGPGEVVGAYHRPEWQREMLLNEMNLENQAP
ncbi:MAG: hypothetical protein DI533_00280 [Cereibacter sphaeroides]|uniref:Uncharacterized protein n=1 Tax=Cereibacter sphaeroides TaxID=1063 RepID=A0A2W5UMT3_CERSP|nr:MAG: hypothetical protein DI533_00280 [Cereibacter sphaeroides]